MTAAHHQLSLQLMCRTSSVRKNGIRKLMDLVVVKLVIVLTVAHGQVTEFRNHTIPSTFKYLRMPHSDTPDRYATRTCNFENQIIKIALQNDSLYTSHHNFVKTPQGKFNILSGICVSIVRDLQLMLNFSYEGVAGTGWMTYDPKKDQLGGMGEQLLTGKVDLSISLNALYIERLKHLAFLHPLHAYKPRIYFQPPNLTSHSDLIFLPFTKTVWKVYGLVILAIFMFAEISGFALQHVLDDQTTTFCDNLLQVTSLLTLQGWWMKDRDKFFLIFFLVISQTCSFLVFSFFTGAFYSVISAPHPLIKDISDFQEFEYTILSNPLEASSFNLFVQVNERTRLSPLRLIGEELFQDTENAVKKVIEPESKYAFATDPIPFYQATKLLGLEDHSLCEIDQLLPNNEDSAVKYVMGAMTVTKNSPYRNCLNVGTMKVMERGLRHRYESQMLLETEPQCFSRQTNFVSLNLKQYRKPFAFLAMAMILSLVALAIELKKTRS